MKLIWKLMKFYTLTHHNTPFTTRQTFTMNCQNTSIKYEKQLKKICSCIFYSQKWKFFFKLQRKLIERMHIADEKPIQPFCHLQNMQNMSKLRIFSTNELNLGVQTKENSKQSSVFKYIYSDKKLQYEKTGSLTNVKVYNSRSKIIVLWHI